MDDPFHSFRVRVTCWPVALGDRMSRDAARFFPRVLVQLIRFQHLIRHWPFMIRFPLVYQPELLARIFRFGGKTTGTPQPFDSLLA